MLCHVIYYYVMLCYVSSYNVLSVFFPLTPAGSVPGVEAPGTAGNTVVPQQKVVRGPTPQTHTAHPAVVVPHTPLTPFNAPWKKRERESAVHLGMCILCIAFGSCFYVFS